MKNPLSPFCILVVLNILTCQVFAQVNALEKGLFLGINLQAGLSTMETSGGFNPEMKSGIGVAGGIELAYFITPNFGIGISPGYSTASSSWTGKLASETFFSSEVSPYYLESNPNDFIPYVLFASDSVKEEIKLGYVDIPLMLKFRFGKGNISGYLDVGGAASFLPSDPQVTGEAYVDFKGLFTQQNVLLQTTGFGFEYQKVVQATPFDPGLETTLFSALFGAGIAYHLSPKTSLRLGGIYRRGLSSISGGATTPDNRREGEFSYRSLLAGGGSLSPSSLNVQVGLSMKLGGNPKTKKPKGTKTPKKNSKKMGCDSQIIPLVVKQIPDSRRNLWEDDPEFNSVANHVRDRVVFLQKNVVLNFGGIEYCPLENDAESLQATLTTGTEGVRYDVVQSGYMPKDGHYLISLEPEKLPVSVEVVDAENTFSLDGFQVYISFQGEELVPLRYMDFGDSIPDLYAHPAITYQLHVETPFYKKAIINIDRTTLLKGYIRIDMHKIRKKKN